MFPTELEQAIRRHPAVHDVAVAGLPDPVLGEIACAWVVAEPAPPPPPRRSSGTAGRSWLSTSCRAG
ncbi:hypothetical protein ACFQYP_25005 [Nonomuraea antimicrobica]